MNKIAKMGLIIFAAASVFCGCGNNQSTDEQASSIGNNDVFSIGNEVCSIAEAKIYISSEEAQYRQLFGDNLSELTVDESETQLDEEVKEKALSELIRIKCLNLMASDYGITLTDEENKKSSDAAAEYYSALNDQEKKYLDVDEDDITDIYKEFLLAAKVYQQKLDDIDCTVSDDEAKVITILQIFRRNTSCGLEGDIKGATDDLKCQVETKMENAQSELEAGDDFSYVAGKYTESSEVEVNVSRGELPSKLEKAAFKLDNGECSKIIETEDGYYIVKCLENNNKDLTASHKKELETAKKAEQFETEFKDYLDSFDSKINQDNWDSIDTTQIGNKLTSFFAVYNKYN